MHSSPPDQNEHPLFIDTEAHLVFEKGGVHDARAAVRELAHVAAKEDGYASFDKLNNSTLHVLDFGVDIEDRTASPNIAKLVDSVQFSEVISGIINQREGVGRLEKRLS